jgi:hypothetical protein
VHSLPLSNPVAARRDGVKRLGKSLLLIKPVNLFQNENTTTGTATVPHSSTEDDYE